MADPSAEAALLSHLTANPAWDIFYFQYPTSSRLDPHSVLRQLAWEIRSHSAVPEILAAESVLWSQSNCF